MKTFLLIIALMQTILWGCSNGVDPAPVKKKEPTFLTGKPKAGQNSANFKGYQAINKTLKARLFSDESEFELGNYINSEVAEDDFIAIFLGTKLTDLMGAHDGTGENQKFKNGKPNTMNMLLWFMAFDRLGKDLGKHCSEKQMELNTKFSTALAEVCSPSEDLDKRKIQMKAFWDALVNFDVPNEEFKSWHKLFDKKISDGESPEVVVSEMVIASFYHPKFLLSN